MTEEEKRFVVEAEILEGGHQKWTMGTQNGALRALDTPLARQYAENLLLQRDMRDSLAAMELWERRFASSEDPEDKLVAGSLFRDAITQFVGCFDKSAEFPVSAKEIYGHHPDGLTSFQWFKDMRDAYSSHKFGAQRQCIVGVAAKDGMAGIGYLMAKMRGQNKEDGPLPRGFMQSAANFLDARVQSLAAELKKQVAAMSLSEIGALKEANVRTLKMEEARFTRADLHREKPAPKR
jgi:hypothetical protein